jgi:hypothetical protein
LGSGDEILSGYVFTELVLVKEKVAAMRRLILYCISFHNIYHMAALVISIMYWHFAQI